MRQTERNTGIAALNALPWVPIAVGAGLVAAGIRNRSFFGGILAAAGGAVLYRAIARPGPDWEDRRPAFARGIMVKKSVNVDRSPEDCYQFWRDLENLGGFMDHVQSVRVVSDTRSRWVAKSLGGMSIEWDSEIVKDVPGHMIGWRSLPGSPMQTSGSVRFESAGRGTQTIVTLKYDPPAGKIGAAIAELLGESPSKRIGEELRRFKVIMEKDTGEKRGGSGTSAIVDPVDVASEDSFPASDPPSWTAAPAQS